MHQFLVGNALFGGWVSNIAPPKDETARTSDSGLEHFGSFGFNLIPAPKAANTTAGMLNPAPGYLLDCVKAPTPLSTTSTPENSSKRKELHPGDQREDEPFDANETPRTANKGRLQQRHLREHAQFIIAK
ncbi:hypothetical protein MRS44_011877 [Fusarium solani]|uniref:uncharacterized protein n=1 Tax=Fusarium solani TaxID=169388 RepID=UPI0032C455C8|nr:hypothetical protein MRS44_011877 [Fusarium solani]